MYMYSQREIATPILCVFVIQILMVFANTIFDQWECNILTTDPAHKVGDK